MKIVVPGGSGHLGALVKARFEARGDQVVVLTRRPAGPGQVHWDGETLGAWAEELDGADVVLNLAGRSVNCRYNQKNMREIMDSRVASSRIVGEAIAAARRPPGVWLQASTATIYRHRLDAPNDEETGLIGGDHAAVPLLWQSSVAVAQSWERELFLAETPSTRRVALRSALVLSPLPGSVFDVMATLARRGMLGTAGSGRQFVSWIHEADFLAALDFLIAHPLSGPVNVCAPNPIPNREFNRTLRAAVGAWVGLPTMRWMLEIGAFFMGTETELVLKSRRVVPRRLQEAGFAFRFSHFADAAAEIAARWRPGRRSLPS